MTADLEREVEYMARLARIALEPGEKKRLAGQLSEILETACKVRELDTAGVEPTAHVISRPVRFREDKVCPSLPRGPVLEAAPAREKEYFKVPSITGEERDGERPERG